MSDEEIQSILRAIKEQLNRIETRQVEMVERQKPIKTKVEETVQGSFGSIER